MLIRPKLALSTLACVFVLSACGGGDAEETTSSTSGGSKTEMKTQSAEGDDKALDACSLLDKNDVEAAIGEAVDKVDGQGTADGAASCSWYGKDTGSLLQKGVTLVAARDNGKERWTSHKTLIGDAARDESGFGDGAFTDGQMIAGYKGDAFVVVAPLYADAGVTLEQVKPLGERVLDALGSS